MSKNVMPPSTAARTMGSAWSSSNTQGRSLSFPKLIIPRHTLDTRRPVFPRFTYRTATSTSRQRHRHGTAVEGRPYVPQERGASRLPTGAEGAQADPAEPHTALTWVVISSVLRKLTGGCGLA